MITTLGSTDDRIVIVKAVQTSLGCPSQWNAWDLDGRYYYLRYRHGHGSVHTFTSEDYRTWTEEEWFNPLVQFDGDDPFDGTIEFDEFCDRAGLTLAPMIEYTCFGRHYNGLVEDVMKAVNSQ
jgi:hypothetical protein